MRVQGRPEKTDEQLMCALAGGDIEALGALYRRHGGMVESALRRFAPELSVAEAEDLGQDVFLRVRRSAGRYREQTRFKAWLYGVAVRTAKHWRRNTGLRRRLLQRFRQDAMELGPPPARSPEQIYAAKESLDAMLGMLSRRQREVLLLHEVEGFCGDEIGRILGIGPSAVWTCLHRARKKLLASPVPQEGDLLQVRCQDELLCSTEELFRSANVGRK